MKEESIKQYFLAQANQIPKAKLVLSRVIRIMIFAFFVLLSVIVDLDSGIIASSSQIVKQDLNMSGSEYGLFVSIHVTGRIIGLVIFMALISFDHRKLLTVSTICLHGASFFMYLFTKNKLILYFVRLFTSIMKVFCSIYMPVWIDQFGLRHHKTIMLTMAYMLSPYGHVIGFNIGTLIFSDKWSYGLSLIGTIMMIIAGIFMLFPSNYFSSKYVYIGYQEKIVNDDNTDDDTKVGWGNKKSIFSDKNQIQSTSRNSIYASADCLNNVNKWKKNDSKSYDETINPFNIFLLFTSGSFIFCALARANLFSIFQIIHQFIKDYIINGLHINNKDKILSYYSITAFIGPSLGSFIGGFISNKLGGYESKKSVLVCIIFGICTCLLVIPLSLCTQLEAFSMALLCFYFTTSGMLPTLTGYTISSVPRELKGAATCVDMLLTSLIGKMPGPIIYGYLNDQYKETSPKFAWRCSLSYYYIGFGFTMIACCFRWKALSQVKSENTMIIISTVKQNSIYLSENDLEKQLLNNKSPIPFHIEKVSDENEEQELQIK